MRPQEQEVAAQDCGFGKRSRKKVNYNDELTETQWAKIIDQGGDLNEEIERAREKRLGRKRPNGTESDSSRKRVKLGENEEVSIGGEEEEQAERRMQEELLQEHRNQELGEGYEVQFAADNGVAAEVGSSAGEPKNFESNQEEEKDLEGRYGWEGNEEGEHVEGKDEEF